MHKSGSSGTLAQGGLTSWTLLFETSEYKFVDGAVVTDTLPNGLCPLGSENFTSGNDPADAECDPVGGQEPSAPYASAEENANGTWTLTWDQTSLAKLGHTGISDKFTITFPTRTRTHYQQNFEPTTPILTFDTISNSVETTGDGFARCLAPGTPDCSTPGEKIDFDGTDGSEIIDTSAAEQEAGGPTISKQVAQSGTNCQAATYVNTVPRYHPGDRVCWRVRVDFPGALDTSPQAISDFLPESVEYEAGSDAPTPSNNVTATTDDSGAGDGLLTWTVTGSTVPAGGEVFEHVFSSIAMPPGAPLSGDLTGNLLKFSSENTPGESVPLRAEAEYAIDTPEVDLKKGVETIVRGVSTVEGPNAANVDNKAVEADDKVTYRVDVANGGAQAAANVEVWDQLPPEYECAAISAISDAGSCVEASPNDRVVWTIPEVAAGGEHKLTYTATVPSEIGPGRTLANEAGVRQFQGETNLGGFFTYTPSANIDPANGTTPNAPAADDPSNVFTNGAAIAKTQVTGVNEGGNNLATQATIGEQIKYTITATVPEGTTLGGVAQLTDAFNNNERQTFVPGTATATLNGGALPAGFALDTSGVTPRVVFPTDYANAPGSGNDLVVLSFEAVVTNVAANTRTAGNLTDQGTLAWTDGGAKAVASNTTSTQIVEPLISQAKTDDVNPSRVDPGDVVTYTVTTSNSSAARVSTAHDVLIVDEVPVGLTPVGPAPTNTPIADGAEIPGSGGAIWDLDTRTITKKVATLAPNGSSAFSYRAEVDKPAIAGASLSNEVEATTASLGEAASGRRTSGTGYKATAKDTVKIGGATIEKQVTPTKATIGETLTYEVTVTIPANVELFDTTVFDTLPSTLEFKSLVSESCVSGCTPATPIQRYAVQMTGETFLAWDLGDIPALSEPRVVKFVYQGYVRDTNFFSGEPIVRGQTADNRAMIASNRTDKREFDETDPPFSSEFDEPVGPVKATTTVIEPKVSIAKEIKVGAGGFTAGPTPAHSDDPLAYRLIVENSGDSPAYDVEVTDTPDAALTNVQFVAQADVTLLDPWTAGDPDMTWRIDGPVAGAGGEVTLEYTADFVAANQLRDGQQVPNTAKVPHYFGLPKATRDANPTHVYRDYTDGGEDSTEAVLDFPTLALEKTTGLAGNPETGNAEINQEFPWRIVVTNTSPTAGAKEVHVHDILPPNWSYETGSTTVTPGGPLEPVVNLVSGSEQLEWTIPVLGPEQSAVIAFRATPGIGAKTAPGTGAEAHVNQAAVILASDEAGNTENEEGPYGTGPDDATATLEVPQLSVEKTPDGGGATAGSPSSFTIEVENEGDGVARNVKVKDLLPANLSYEAGTATANPSTGFSETAVSPGPGPNETTIEWAIASIPAHSSVQIELPVKVAAEVADGATLTNTAAVTSDEETTPVEDEGSLNVETEADMAIEKTGDLGYTAGENYTWHLRVRNLGPSNAENVVVADPLPAGTTFVSATAPCTHASGEVKCELGDQPPSFDQTYDVTVKVDPGTTTSPLDNTASVDTETEDPNPANDESTFGPTAGSLADVWIEKSADPTAILKQHETTFTIAIHNDGPSVARNVEIEDPLPAGLVFVSADDAACSDVSNTVTCTVGDLAANAERTFQITVRGTVNGVHENTATVTTTTPEPTGHKPNSDEAEVEVLPVADLAIEKTAPATVSADGPLTWTLKATNNGEDPATGVTMVDPLPAGVVFSSAGSGCSEAAGTVTCLVGDLAVGESVERQITVTVPLALAETTVLNSATVDGDQGDDEPANDSDEASSTVDPAADVWIEKSADPTAFLKHHETTFTITIHNDGPSVARNVEINDPLPAALVFVSADDAACTEAAGTVNCTIGDLAANAERTVRVTVRGILNGVYDNTATVTTTTPEPPGHKPNSDEAEVEVGPVADLALEKTGPATVAADGQLTWTLKATNNGEDDATGVTIVDPLPAGVVFASADAGCALASDTVTCDVGALANGESAERQVTVTVPRALADTTVVNSASVDGDQGDDEPANDSDEAQTTVDPSADVSIVKSGPNRVNANGTIAWTLAIANAGPSTATGVLVKDALPAGVQLTSATPTQGSCAGAVECQLGALPKGGAAQIQIVAKVPVSLQGTNLANVATVTAAEPDPVPENNESKTTTIVDPPSPSDYDLAIAKTVEGQAELGGTLRYEIAVVNHGPAAATGVKIVDALPGSVEYVSASLAGGKCSTKGAVLTCQLDSLLAGAEKRATVTVRVKETGPIANTATVSAAVADANPNNNRSTARTKSLLGPAKLKVTKTTLTRGTVEPGDRVRFKIQVRNFGQSPAADVIVCDRLPTAMTFARIAGARLEKGDACWTLDLLPVGGKKTFRLAGKIDGGVGGGVVRNVAYVKADNAPKRQGVAGVQVESAGPGRAGGVTG